jgi:hypothetical protein
MGLLLKKKKAPEPKFDRIPRLERMERGMIFEWCDVTMSQLGQSLDHLRDHHDAFSLADAEDRLADLTRLIEELRARQ